MITLPLRWRIILALVALAVGTSFALSLLARNFLDRGLEFSVNLEMGQALNQALDLAKKNYDLRKLRMQQAGERLSGSPLLREAFQAKDLDRLKSDLQAHNLPRLDLQFLSLETIARDYAASERQIRPAVFKHPGRDDRLCLWVPIVDRNRSLGVLLAEASLEPLITVERAVQTFKHLDMNESGLRRGFLLAFLVAAGGVVLVACLIGVRMGFGITRPLYALIKGTREMARDNLDYRIEGYRDDEIGLLIESFNRMAEDLKENRRKRLEAEQIAAWREIARRLAHEIKNPLTPIQLTVQQMRDKYPGGDPVYAELVKDCTEIVTEEVENLRALVEEFASFARLPSLSLEPNDLNALVRDVIRLYPDARIELDLDPSLAEIALDTDQIRRVLINLIENGIEAAGRSGEIRLSTRKKEDSALLSVSDSGPGVPQDERERIFQPYVFSKESGMGLGLAVVKGIVEEHGGRISVGDAPGRGAKFEIRMPLPDETEQGEQERAQR